MVGAHPSRKSLLATRARSAFFSTPLSPGSHKARRETKHAAKRSTGGTPGNGRAAANSEAGTSIIKSPDRSRSTARSRTSRARANTRRERVCTATDQPPLPGSGKGTRERHGRRKDNREPDASTRGPHELQREVRAGQHSGQTAAPLPSTHHQHRWGGEARGPLAEREERPPFAVNGHSP